MFRAETARSVRASRLGILRHIFFALFLSSFLFCCAWGFAYAKKNAPVNGVALFLAETTKLSEKVDDAVPMRDVKSFASPFLAAGNGVIVALAEARYARSDEESVDIVAKCIETEGENWAYNASGNNESNSKTQLNLPNKVGKYHYAMRNPTAVIKGNKIYLLTLHNRRPGVLEICDCWHLVVVVGEIMGERGHKTIKWNTFESLRSKLAEKLYIQGLSVFPGSAHSALLTSKGTIVFSVDAKNKEGKRGFVIMQLKNDDKEQWEVSFAEKPKECRVFSLFEWKERLISTFSGCLGSNGRVMQYGETAKGWKDAEDVFYVWSSKGTSRDLAPVTIGNKNVLLFPQKSFLQSYNGGKCEIFLWFSDGSRVNRAGSIRTQDDHIASGVFLYTNGELFFMYQDIRKGSGSIVFKRLNYQLWKLTSSLNIWAEKDAYLSKPCSETAPEGVSPDTLCVTPVPTAGLVGFLSDRGDATHWFDDYHFTAAWVNGTKVKNGYTFCGTYSGAWWPVGRASLSKWYNFAKYGMTVVATVTVHETPKNDTPLLTVDGGGVKQPLGFWYKANQWKVVSKNGQGPAIELRTQKEYRVALMVHNNTISAYVNGKLRGSALPISTSGSKSLDVEGILIGGYGRGSGMNMTVTNVFFYYRVLSEAELKAVSKTIETATLRGSEKPFEAAVERTTE